MRDRSKIEARSKPVRYVADKSPVRAQKKPPAASQGQANNKQHTAAHVFTANIMERDAKPPLALSDAELDALMAAAAPLDRDRRDAANLVD
jgi:hypothetical protein